MSAENAGPAETRTPTVRSDRIGAPPQARTSAKTRRFHQTRGSPTRDPSNAGARDDQGVAAIRALALDPSLPRDPPSVDQGWTALRVSTGSLLGTEQPSAPDRRSREHAQRFTCDQGLVGEDRAPLEPADGATRSGDRRALSPARDPRSAPGAALSGVRVEQRAPARCAAGNTALPRLSGRALVGTRVRWLVAPPRSARQIGLPARSVSGSAAGCAPTALGSPRQWLARARRLDRSGAGAGPVP